MVLNKFKNNKLKNNFSKKLKIKNPVIGLTVRSIYSQSLFTKNLVWSLYILRNIKNNSRKINKIVDSHIFTMKFSNYNMAYKEIKKYLYFLKIKKQQNFFLNNKRKLSKLLTSKEPQLINNEIRYLNVETFYISKFKNTMYL